LRGAEGSCRSQYVDDRLLGNAGEFSQVAPRQVPLMTQAPEAAITAHRLALVGH